MQLTAVLLLGICLHVAASGRSQTVTFSGKDVPLEKVFTIVKQQTGLFVSFSKKLMRTAKPITIFAKNLPLQQFLEEAFSGQPFEFVIKANTIFVGQKEITVRDLKHGYPFVKTMPPITVRGRIVNEKGEPVMASILVKGTNRGTTSDENGKFELNNIDADAIFIITASNIETIATGVNGQLNINIAVKMRAATLNDVIVNKGYYTERKELSTGNVVKVNSAQIANQPVSNPILALQGLVPGLLITQNNGLPGSRFTALIRGQNSIQNGNSPLFIVDGVPFLSSNDALIQLNGMLANSPFNSLDPGDIESIEVLKDADATAIYGSRGAGGVILITTKKAKAEKSLISLNIYRGWGKVARTMKMMNTQQFLEMRKEAFLNDSITPDFYTAPDLVSWDQNRYTDWKKEFIGGTAQVYSVQARYSGGSQRTKFSVGTGYYKETTVFPGDFDDKKTTADIQINHKSADNKLNVSFITSYSYDKSMLPALDLTSYISLAPNSYPLMDAAGNYVWREADYSVGNPLAAIQQINDIITDRLTANSIIAYKPVKAIEIKATVGYNRIGANQTGLYPMSSQDPAYSPTGSSIFGDKFIRTWIVEPQASYKLIIKQNLKIEALAGSTLQKTESATKLITANGYTNDNLLSSVAAAPYLTASNSKSQYHYAAIFGRIGMDWNSKYVLNITGRRDGSSRFGPGHQFANFGAAGVAWIFTKESFMNRAAPFLSFGKLRGSYGSTGNDQIGNYQYLDTYRGTNFPYQNQPGLMPERLFNSDYSWEENRKLELAAELGFFQDRVSVNLNYYENKSDNQIIRYSLPTQTGFANILVNFPGVVQNKGYELQLNADVIKNKSFQWNISFNISHNQNKLVAFPGLENSSYSTSYVIGKSLNAYMGLHFTGVDAATGIYQFEDSNKDGIIDNADYAYYGTTDPRYFGGLSNSFNYKGFQLSILLEFRKQLGLDAIYYLSPDLGSMINQSLAALNRWRKPGDITPYQRYTQDFINPAFTANYNIRSSDAALTDASYIRLRNIAFSYDIPENWLKKINGVSWKLYLHVQNLFTITRYKGHDPENQSSSSLPPLKMITAGTQITF